MEKIENIKRQTSNLVFNEMFTCKRNIKLTLVAFRLVNCLFGKNVSIQGNDL